MTTWHSITATTERGAKIKARNVIWHKERAIPEAGCKWQRFSAGHILPTRKSFIDGDLALRWSGYHWFAAFLCDRRDFYTPLPLPGPTPGATEDTQEGNTPAEPSSLAPGLPGCPDTRIAALLLSMAGNDPGTRGKTPEDTARCLVEWLAADGWTVVRSGE